MLPAWYNEAKPLYYRKIMFRFIKSFDWKNSEPHLLMLNKFIHGQESSYFTKWGDWENVLKEPPQKAIKRFVDEKMLASADLETVVSYKYKVGDLKNLLRERKLPVSGTKDELVKRIVDADKTGMLKLTAGMELLVCTHPGCEIAEQYTTSQKEKRLKVEQQVTSYLAKRMFKEASLTVAGYEAEQVFPRGLGVDWKHYNPNRDVEILKSIYEKKPEILNQLEDSKLEAMRLAAGMMLLWGENRAAKWLPSDFETNIRLDKDTAARMFLFNAQSIASLKQFREMGVKYVEVSGTPDSCESCKKTSGKRFKLTEAPILPNPDCTHEMGCRCVYLPRTD
jgi:hypothetical protein